MSRFRLHLPGHLPAVLSVLAAFLLALTMLPATAGARTPLAVDLIRFELRSVEEGVEIEWETGTEQDVAYFQVKRGPTPDGPFALLDEIGLIAAEGSTFAGATYTVVDQSAATGESYFYQLYEITLDNAEHLVAGASISLVPTPTPEIIGGGGSGGATSTPAPTSTRAGASTPAPTSNGTATGTTATPGGTAAPTLTGEPQATATATRAARVLGPTPTRFSFTPSAPVSNASQGSSAVVEAAGPSGIAQVTADPYPAPGATVAITPLAPSAEVGATQAPLVYPQPGNAGAGSSTGALPSSVGQGQDDNGTGVAPGAGDATVTETSSTTRILLWFGFLAALFIFIGGIAVSIILSTRQRHSDEP